MKNELRILFKQIRKDIKIQPELYVEQLQKIISTDSSISIYYPLANELNILSILPFLSKNKILLPILQQETEPLLFSKFIINQTKLQMNKFKIFEPIEQEYEIPQFCIVPLLCFDPLNKHRIGYGGGFYDRTIAHYRSQNHNTKFIGFGHELLKVKNIPYNINDQQLDFIITDQYVYH
ncbi:unnamed protein product [Paramecium sonneborni]|uniref:5-formyltetrahydrofolate cyclo-ligase n=1 Tax=Paramecium sonneborni TaxID=65129 RepID=A0A8S1NLI5_9CILI|nr:unnamed protein product [Paramecium sonneborni]